MTERKSPLTDPYTIDFPDFSEVVQAFTDSYARIIHNGSPASDIAMAMLGATMNVYEMFGLRAELPGLFRSLADQIETEKRIN